MCIHSDNNESIWCIHLVFLKVQRPFSPITLWMKWLDVHSYQLEEFGNSKQPWWRQNHLPRGSCLTLFHLYPCWQGHGHESTKLYRPPRVWSAASRISVQLQITFSKCWWWGFLSDRKLFYQKWEVFWSHHDNTRLWFFWISFIAKSKLCWPAHTAQNNALREQAGYVPPGRQAPGPERSSLRSDCPPAGQPTSFYA